MKQNDKTRILASIDYASFKSLDLTNLKDEEFLDYIFDAFKIFPFFSKLKYFGILGKKRKLLSSFSEAKTELKKLKSKSYIFSSSLDDVESESILELDIEDISLNIRLILTTSEIELDKNLKLLKKAIILFFATFKKILEFDLVSTICLPDREFPQTRPPRLWRKFNPTGVIDVINPNKVDSDDIKPLIMAIEEGNLPVGINKTKIDNNLILIDWLEVEKAEGNIDDTISIRCRWIYDHSDFLQRSNYNSIGDKLVTILDKIKTPYFTFYSRFAKVAYQVYVPDPNTNIIDRESLNKLINWLEKGQSPDGFEITKIDLIFPTREDAIHYKPEVERFGFSTVLYPDNKGNLWDPFPKGLWLD